MGEAVTGGNADVATVSGGDGKRAWERQWLVEMPTLLLQQRRWEESMGEAVTGGNAASGSAEKEG